ncbi:MAG: hypothetical protein U0572_13680 [Phycisphaerales bacterium]
MRRHSAAPRVLRSLAASFACLVLGGCALFEPARPALPENAVPPIDTATGEERIRMWREDVDSFEKLLRQRHGGLFVVLPESSFNAQLASLRTDLPTLSDDQIVVRLQAIAASIGSGHTAVHVDRGKLVPARLPIELRWLSDGVLVTATTEEYAELRGERFVGIGDYDLDTVIASVTKITPHENQAYLTQGATKLLVEAQTLHGLGLVDDPNNVPIRVKTRDGDEMTRMVAPVAPGTKYVLISAVDPKQTSFTRLPRPENSLYGTKFVEESRTLYVWYDACRDDKTKSVAEFSRDALKEIDTLQPRLVVVDLRRNGGGNSALLHPLIDGIATRPRINDPKRLVVLIGSNTFSSAGLNAGEFKSRTKATLMGQPTGQRPDSWFECRWDWLPNSLLRVTYMLWAPSFKPGEPDSYMPDIYVPVTCEDWLSGRDLTYERALKLAPQN